MALSVFDPFTGFATGQFIGFSSSTAFSSVTIASLGGFTCTVDSLRAVDASAPVPAPGSLALSARALLALGGFRLRRVG